ncbi:MAG: MerR family transcriptional regulator [Oscillospiraceae bacterium]|nr:MerR family transcriptional regulator [Oscillospiraceae bacterium]
MASEREAVERFCRSHAMEPALFSVRQVCEAVGLSRAMLVELERKGFLTPARVNPKTGYRYYDAFNVSRIEQYQTLRAMGLTQQDVFAYFDDTSDRTREILTDMKRRLALLQNSVDALSLRLRRDTEFHLSEVRLSDVTCYCRTVVSRGPDEGERFAYRTYEEAIARGFRLLPTEPMFLLRLEFAKDRTDGKYLTKMCIPIEPVDPQEKNADGVELIPGGRALSVLCCGDYQNNTLPNQGFAFLLSEIKRRGLTVAGGMRQISIVVPGVNICSAPEDYVLRLAIPVE